MEPNEVNPATGDVLNPVTPIFRPPYEGTSVTNGRYENGRKCGDRLWKCRLGVFRQAFPGQSGLTPDLPQWFA